MAPKISIIVPAFNEEKYISRCLDSILNQTFSDFEVICIDDGSTDNTFKILTEYSEKDSRIIPLKNPGKGVSSARNFGIENSHGEYIGFVDSDDFIQPQMYEFLYKALQNNNSKLSFCNFIHTNQLKKNFFNYYDECIKTDEINQTVDLYTFHNELILSVIWNKLIHKSIITNYFEDYIIGEDTVFSSLLWSQIDKAVFVNLPLYNYCFNSESTSSLSPTDKKWLYLIKTRFIAYENYNQFNKNIATYFLNKGMKILLSYRMYSENNDKELLTSLYKENKKFYYLNNKISIKNKIYVSISFHFPFIYKIFRKLLDNTID